MREALRVGGAPRADLVTISLLGRFSVAVGGQAVRLTTRGRAVLALLALQCGQVVGIGALGEALWDGHPPAAASNAIRNAICSIRRALGEAGCTAEVIATEGWGYRLVATAVLVDAVRFERLTRDARRAVARGAAAGLDGQAAADALALWHGDGVPALEGLPGAQAQVRYLQELHRTALEARIEGDLLAGRHAHVVGELEVLVARYPLWEAAWGQLMRALVATGRPGDALQTYARLRAVLRDDWGLDPSPPLRQLHQRILEAGEVPQPSAGTGGGATAAAYGVSAGATLTELFGVGSVTCTA